MTYGKNNRCNIDTSVRVWNPALCTYHQWPRRMGQIFSSERLRFVLSRFNCVWDWWLIVWFLSTCCTECIWRNSSLHSGVAEAFVNSILGISTFRDSFRRIGNVLFNHSAQTMYISVVALTSVGENTFRLLFK